MWNTKRCVPKRFVSQLTNWAFGLALSLIFPERDCEAASICCSETGAWALETVGSVCATAHDNSLVDGTV